MKIAGIFAEDNSTLVVPAATDAADVAVRLLGVGTPRPCGRQSH